MHPPVRSDKPLHEWVVSFSSCLEWWFGVEVCSLDRQASANQHACTRGTKGATREGAFLCMGCFVEDRAGFAYMAVPSLLETPQPEAPSKLPAESPEAC